MTDNIEPIGDTALALVVAHEQGHRVQALLGLKFARTFDSEQQADCLAGYWAADVYRRGLIEPDDFSEFAGLSTVIADQPGVPLDDPRAHGNAEQRRAAFEKGYNTGNAGDCTGYASNAA
jgi:predicted metalloprotease